MNVLIMGGTLFLGRHIVEAALKRGHDVTLFNRGLRHPGLFPTVDNLTGDRNTNLHALAGRRFDAVIDPSAYRPEQIGSLLDALGEAPPHYTFVSTVSVYREFAPRQRFDESASVLEGHEGYGALKARAEEALQAALPGRTSIVRPGLIAGPYDPTGRLTYWPSRIDAGGEVLAPGRPERPVQFIDARDLAEWLVRLTEDRVGGVFQATGPHDTLTMAQFLDACLAVTRSDAQLTWMPDEDVVAAGIEGWTELPLWIAEDDAEAGGIFYADNRHAIEHGLRFRPLTETLRDTLDWWRKASEGEGETGADTRQQVKTLSAEKERETLVTLRARPSR
jgi:2'-hydroxyisoflavone reductase